MTLDADGLRKTRQQLVQLLQDERLDLLLVLLQVFQAEGDAGVDHQGRTATWNIWTDECYYSDAERWRGDRRPSRRTCIAFAGVCSDVSDDVAVGNVTSRPGEAEDHLRREEEAQGEPRRVPDLVQLLLLLQGQS